MPQSSGLGRTSAGAYTFSGNVVPEALRVVNQACVPASPHFKTRQSLSGGFLTLRNSLDKFLRRHLLCCESAEVEPIIADFAYRPAFEVRVGDKTDDSLGNASANHRLGNVSQVFLDLVSSGDFRMALYPQIYCIVIIFALGNLVPPKTIRKTSFNAGSFH